MPVRQEREGMQLLEKEAAAAGIATGECRMPDAPVRESDAGRMFLCLAVSGTARKRLRLGEGGIPHAGLPLPLALL